METDTRNKLNVNVFRQFRRLPDQELKWILPRPVTSSIDENIISSDEEMHVDVSAADKAIDVFNDEEMNAFAVNKSIKRKMNEFASHLGQNEKTKKDVSAADTWTKQLSSKTQVKMPEVFTKHLLHPMISSLKNVLKQLSDDFTRDQKLCIRT